MGKARRRRRARARGRDPGSPRDGSGGAHQPRRVARPGPRRRAPRIRQCRAGDGIDSRSVGRGLARSPGAGPALRRSLVAPRAGVQCGRHRDTGARHRREHRDVHGSARDPPPATAISRSPARSSSSSIFPRICTVSSGWTMESSEYASLGKSSKAFSSSAPTRPIRSPCSVPAIQSGCQRPA